LLRYIFSRIPVSTQCRYIVNQLIPKKFEDSIEGPSITIAKAEHQLAVSPIWFHDRQFRSIMDETNKQAAF
jgi:hypothetical protein